MILGLALIFGGIYFLLDAEHTEDRIVMGVVAIIGAALLLR